MKMETILDVWHRLVHSKPMSEVEQRQAHDIIDASGHLLPAPPAPELPDGPDQDGPKALPAPPAPELPDGPDQDGPKAPADPKAAGPANGGK
jgi:hypothetical protein